MNVTSLTAAFPAQDFLWVCSSRLAFRNYNSSFRIPLLVIPFWAFKGVLAFQKQQEVIGSHILWLKWVITLDEIMQRFSLEEGSFSKQHSVITVDFLSGSKRVPKSSNVPCTLHLETLVTGTSSREAKSLPAPFLCGTLTSLC